MARKRKKKSKKSASVFTLCLYSLFWFDLRICLNPLSCILMFVLRSIVFYFAYLHVDQIGNFIIPQGEDFKVFSFSNLIYFLFLTLPLLAFTIWYSITTFFLFVGGIKSVFGFQTNFDDEDSIVGEDYSEINRFLGWRNNKMRFMSYEDSAKIMVDTGVLNNLNTQDPEAKRTLDYINNRMRFKSYEDSLKYLRGEKK